jgi:hypothetical protein
LPEAPAGIASPISLLLEEADHGAREVLLLSFTLNLAFWERFALGAARGLGARVTVVSDAGMTSADLGQVRYAGLTYLDGRASCRQGGAFHPKLLVIADEGRATVVLGSGNATVSGWHDNAELWTVLRGDSSGAPAAFAQVAQCLRHLPERVDFSHGVERALESVADLLDGLPSIDNGPRLVSSLDQPIIEQLPGGPVTELLVAAPFHDRSERAVRNLVERLRPNRLRIYVQPRKTVFDGAELLKAVTEDDVAQIADDRYHHGKLYEWVAAGRRQTLTGSPNLSTGALCRAMAEGANCELGLVADIQESLAPAADHSVGAELVAHRYRESEETTWAISFLGATLVDDTIELLLQRPLERVADVDIACGGEWSTVGTFPRGTTRHALPLAGSSAGAALRLRVGDDTSNTVFVLDPSRVLRVRVAHQGRVLVNEDDLFDSPAIAEAFFEDIAALRAVLHASGSRGIAGRVPRDDEATRNRERGPVEFQSWEEYLDACASLVGGRLLDFALGLPRLGLTDEAAPRPERSSIAELDGDRDVEAADPDEEEPLPHLEDCSSSRRKRYQRWCKQLAELAPGLVPAGRLLAVRLILRAGAGGLWPNRADWLPILGDAVTALAEPAEAFQEERAATTSLAIVGLAAIHGEVRSFATWSPERSIFDKVKDALVGLITDADVEAVERYARELVPALGNHLETTAIMALRDDLLTQDAIEEAVATCSREFGIEATREGSLIRLIGAHGGDLRWKLLRVIGLAEKATIVGAWAASSDGSEMLVVWKRPDLVVAKTTSSGMSGKWYVLDGLQSPHVLATTQELPGDHSWWPQGESPPAKASKLLHEVGFSYPRAPSAAFPS